MVSLKSIQTEVDVCYLYKILAEKEGVFAEPASAASVAGLLKLIDQKYFKKVAGEKCKIVCILTGHGLKDPERAIKTIKPPKVIKADFKTILKEIDYS